MCLVALLALACGRARGPDSTTSSTDTMEAGSGGAPPSAPGEPELLYDMGTLRPRGIVYAERQLYFGAFPPHPRPGYEFYQAPADASSPPQLLGMINTPDAGVAGQVIAATEDYVFWAEASRLVRYERTTASIEHFDSNFAPGLPDARVVLVDEERVAIAQGDCSRISLFEIESMKRKTFEIEPLKNDALAAQLLVVGQTFYCSSQQRILVLDLKSGESRDIYLTPAGRHLDEFIGFRDAIYVAHSAPHDKVTLERLDPSSAASKHILDLEGEVYLSMVADEARSAIFAVPATANDENLYKIAVDSWQVSQFRGLAKLRSDVVQDEDYLYWSTDNLLDKDPQYRTGIYRQLKDAPTQ